MAWADQMLGEKQAELIRKALDAAIYTAPISTALPSTIVNTGGTDLAPPPVGFGALGHHSEDGVTWGRETENSDITSHGQVDPTRSDIRRITSTVQVTAQETNLRTLEASLGLSFTGTPSLANGGEVTLTEPTRPKSVYYRLLGLAVDDSDDGEIYIGRLFPRAKVTEVGEQVWSDGDDAMVRQLTFQAYQDATAGFAVRHFFGGPGWNALLTKMGFPAAA